MSTNNNQVENRLWGAADELRANSKLKASEYSIPVLGLIFLRYADVKFVEAEKQIGQPGSGRRRSTGGKERYQAMGVLYLPEAARFGDLLKLPEGENIGQAINDAMRAIEAENPDLKDVLPKTYNRLENATLVELLKLMGSIPMDIEGDAFGKIYEFRQGNTYYEDLHDCPGKFDFVMANPPFNVDRVDKERLKDDPRFPFGMPRTDNANYLWIQNFYSALSTKGRAGFVMANSASDARASELEIRKQLIEANAVDVMVAVGSNFFYTVTLPCTLWFLDRGKRGTEREDRVLFIDARHIYRQLDRAHRDFDPQQIEFLANIVGFYRGEEAEDRHGSAGMLAETFPEGSYQDVPGLCKVATIEEIEAQGWSLNPGRYVGVAARDEDDFDFFERLEELNEELEVLNSEARELEERIAENTMVLLEAQR